MDDILDGVGGFVEGRFEFAVGAWRGSGSMVKEAVGEQAGELVMEEDEQKRHLGPLFSNAMRIAFPVAGEQHLRLQFSQAAAQLIEALAVRTSKRITHIAKWRLNESKLIELSLKALSRRLILLRE